VFPSGTQSKQVTNGGVVCMAQTDKQPKWFPQAKVRQEPGGGHGEHGDDARRAELLRHRCFSCSGRKNPKPQIFAGNDFRTTRERIALILTDSIPTTGLNRG